VAATGNELVLAGPGKRFTLLNGTTRARRDVRWPSTLSLLDQPAADPTGRFVALAFGNPAWGGGGRQALDVWLLDTKTNKLNHLPGMPAFVSLKYTSLAWTSDNRLVLLGESLGKSVVAVWRPWARRLAIKTVHLPKRTGESDSFAPVG
jgi:hypothetical protein